MPSDPSVVRPADAPQPLRPGAHPAFLNPPLPLTGTDVPVSKRPDPPLPLTGPKLGLFSVDAPVFRLPEAQDIPPTPTKSHRPVPQPLAPPEGPPKAENPTYVDDCGERMVCLICNRERNHRFPRCPFMLLATLVYKANPPRCFEYHSYFAQYEDVGIRGFGYAYYFEDEAEWSAAEAARLHKQDGLNLVKITNLPKETSDPEQLYNVFKTFGPVTHVLTFPDHGFGFVGFVSEQGAKTAIRKLNSSGSYGHLALATVSP